MARTHQVAIMVEIPGEAPVGFDARGERLSMPPPEPGLNRVQAVRIGPGGTRVTLWWTLWSFRDGQAPLLAGLLIMITAVVGSAFWFLQRQLRPLAWLHGGVEAMARGDFTARVPVVRHDEIGQVAGAFNDMAAQVGRMIEERERLLADVSHELRSPIARMKVALELIPPGGERESLARDLREMESLVSVLLDREAARAREGRSPRKEVDLSDLAASVAAEYTGRGPGVDVATPEPATLRGDPALLKLLVRNLVDNAIKFSTPDSRPVKVSVKSGTDRIFLRILDDGPGIPPGSEERILEPFVKLDPARGHHAGYGLGLDLCRRIAEAHGGSIRIASRRPRGTEAVVELPRQP